MQKHSSFLSSTQESREFAEGPPLWVSALPTCRPAEVANSNSTIRSFCHPLSAPTLLLLHDGPHILSQPVYNPNIPTQPQQRLPSPDAGTNLSQPQPNTTAALALAMARCWKNRKGADVEAPFFLHACWNFPAGSKYCFIFLTLTHLLLLLQPDEIWPPELRRKPHETFLLLIVMFMLNKLDNNKVLRKDFRQYKCLSRVQFKANNC